LYYNTIIYIVEYKNGSLNIRLDEHEHEVKANPQNVFKPINEIGGQNGWYYANILWKVRGWMDLLADGVGIRRTRRNTQNYIIGDALDWWKNLITYQTRWFV